MIIISIVLPYTNNIDPEALQCFYIGIDCFSLCLNAISIQRIPQFPHRQTMFIVRFF